MSVMQCSLFLLIEKNTWCYPSSPHELAVNIFICVGPTIPYLWKKKGKWTSKLSRRQKNERGFREWILKSVDTGTQFKCAKSHSEVRSKNGITSLHPHGDRLNKNCGMNAYKTLEQSVFVNNQYNWRKYSRL